MNNNTELFSKKFREKFESLDKIDDVLLELKANGAGQIECIKVICIELKLSLKQADDIVLNSKVWSEFKEGNLRLRKLF